MRFFRSPFYLLVSVLLLLWLAMGAFPAWAQTGASNAPDAMLQYDPGGGSYAFSYIGYNGTMAGGGDTEDTRWDDALKYRITYGPAHFGAMYKFADGSAGCYSGAARWTAATCTPEQAHNNAYGFDLGGEYRKFSADVVYQAYNQAIAY